MDSWNEAIALARYITQWRMNLREPAVTTDICECCGHESEPYEYQKDVAPAWMINAYARMSSGQMARATKMRFIHGREWWAKAQLDPDFGKNWV